MSDTEYMDAEIVDDLPGTALAHREGASAVAAHGGDAMGLLLKAVEQGATPEVLSQLMDLKDRIDQKRAREAFFSAMTAFRSECPPIPRTRANTQFEVTRNGVKRPSMYAALEDIDRIARPVAAKHGLSWTWDTQVQGDAMRVACRVAHVDGHSEETSVTMPTESRAGSSPQQKYGSAQTYGMRYSLVAALGLTTADEDTDGAGRGGENTVAAASKEEIADIEALMDEVGANRERFLGFMGIRRLEDLPASSVQIAIRTLEQKRGGGA